MHPSVRIERPHIILVEDNPADEFLFREALRQNGVTGELLVFRSGLSAMEFVRGGSDVSTRQLCLFVLDITLPGIDGRELIAAIRENPRFEGATIIVWTALESPNDRQTFEALGADLYFLKSSKAQDFFSIGGIIRDRLQDCA